MKPVPRLETAVNIATLVLCCAVLLALLRPVSGPRPTSPERSTALRAGERLPSLDELYIDRTEQSLLMVLTETCKYCEASLPFYQRVVEHMAGDIRTGRIQFILLTPDGIEAGAAYLRRSNLPLQQVVHMTSAQRDALKVSGTPTLILVDRSGIVRHVWLGKLDGAHEKEVLAALSAD